MNLGTSALLLTFAAALSLTLVLLNPPSLQLVAGGRLGGTEVIGTAFPKRLIDPIGREHVLDAPPQRVVSAILAGDEMLAALVPVERVAGVTFLVDDAGISNVTGHYPQTIPRIHAKIEELLALEPDLVLVATHSDAIAVRLLLGAGVPVARFAAFDGFEEVAENILTLGEMLGEPQRARSVVVALRQRIAAVRRRVAGRPRPRVLYYGLGGSTGGPGSLMDEMIELAGGYNLVRDTGMTGYRRLNVELAVALQPEAVIVSDWSGGGGAPSAAELLRTDPAWRQVPAIRHDRVYALPATWVTSGSQFRVAGVEALARLLHPKAFDDQNR